MKTERKKFCAKLFDLSKFLILLIVFSIVLPTSNIKAQKRKSRKITRREIKGLPLRAEIIDNMQLCVPKGKNYFTILQVNEDSNLILSTQTENGSKMLVGSQPLANLKEILAKVDKDQSNLVVRADSVLNFQNVVNVLKNVRSFYADCVDIEASKNEVNPYVYFTPEPNFEDKTLNRFPNPLILVININANGNLELNNENQGSINNTDVLRDVLIQVFKAREDNGVFREGTNEIEKRVFVKAATSVKYGDVMKVIDAIKEAGASPVGLLIDN